MLLNHVVFADETNKTAKELLANVYTQLGYQTEAGTWRNIYLTGAQELRDGVPRLPGAVFPPSFIAATSSSMIFDLAAVRVNPDTALAKAFKINLVLTDRGEKHLLSIQNGVLIHEQNVVDPQAGATVKMTLKDFLMTAIAKVPVNILKAKGNIAMEGDSSLYGTFVDIIEPADANWPIVTP